MEETSKRFIDHVNEIKASRKKSEQRLYLNLFEARLDNRKIIGEPYLDKEGVLSFAISFVRTLTNDEKMTVKKGNEIVLGQQKVIDDRLLVSQISLTYEAICALELGCVRYMEVHGDEFFEKQDEKSKREDSEHKDE